MEDYYFFMKYNVLGETGIRVSEIGFGAEWLPQHNQEEITEILDFSLRSGINFIDIWMSEPDVRSKIGVAIEGCRDEWVIQGHVGSTWQNNQYVRTREMDKVKEAFEDLLTRLRTDYIDFGMIHFVDELSDYHEIMDGEFLEHVKELKSDGFIRHIGLSTHNPNVGKLAVESGEIELIMFSINPAYDMLPPISDVMAYSEDNTYSGDLSGIAVERSELYQLCESSNIPLIAMKGFAGGRLLSSDLSPFGTSLSPIQCIHYALSRPGASSIMVGLDNISEVKDSLAYELASDEEKDFGSILANAPKHSFHGQCTYCGHCAPCSANIDIAIVNKFYDLAVLHDNIPDSVRAHYNNLSFNADDCTQCGDCEKRCPFNVPVMEIMEKAKKLF